MSFHLRHVLPPVLPVTDGEPATLTATPSRTFVAAIHLLDAEEERLLGNDDLASDPTTMPRTLADERDWKQILLVAVAGPDPREDISFSGTDDQPDTYGHTPTALSDTAATGVLGLPTTSSVMEHTSRGVEEAPDSDLADVVEEAEVLGYAIIQMPRNDNPDQAWIYVTTRRGQRRRGIAHALLGALEEIARENGRSVLHSYTTHEPAPAGSNAPALTPTEGSGALPVDFASHFVRRRGWELAQVETHSVLEVAEGLDRADALQAEADAARGEDYEILTWTGRTPPEWRADLAALYQRMSVDIPLGDLDWEEEAWDVGRLERMEQRRADAGQTVLTAAARHRGTGRLVAFTVLQGSPGIPAVTQEETLVHGEHRGHRLGLAVKLANLRLLAAEAPERVRIHTWNADENAHMLAINHRMGFRTRLVEGLWQKQLSPRD